MKDANEVPLNSDFVPLSHSLGVPVVPGVPANVLLIKLPKLLFPDSGGLGVGAKARPCTCCLLTVHLSLISRTVWDGEPWSLSSGSMFAEHLPAAAGKRQWCLVVRNMMESDEIAGISTPGPR